MWKTFFFDSNLAFGLVRSKEDWLEIYAAQQDYDTERNVEWLRRAKVLPRSLDEKIPNFGFRMEHDGELTLGEWADKEGIDLSV